MRILIWQIINNSVINNRILTKGIPSILTRVKKINKIKYLAASLLTCDEKFLMLTFTKTETKLVLLWYWNKIYCPKLGENYFKGTYFAKPIISLRDFENCKRIFVRQNLNKWRHIFSWYGGKLDHFSYFNDLMVILWVIFLFFVFLFFTLWRK